MKHIKVKNSKLWCRLTISLAAFLLIYFFVFYTQNVSGKMLHIESELFSNDRVVTFRTNDGQLLKLFLYDKVGIKWFDSEPNKILLKNGNSSVEVSLDKFLSDATSGSGNFPSDGFDVTIKYNPNFPKKIFWVKRLDGEIKEISYNVSKPALGNNQFFTLNETSRDIKKLTVTYSYKFNVAPPDAWYFINGENGEVTSYLKNGERFIRNFDFSFGSPEIKFLEEFKENNNSCLINFRENPSNAFQVTFSDKEKMIQNSYLIEENLTKQVIKDVQR